MPTVSSRPWFSCATPSCASPTSLRVRAVEHEWNYLRFMRVMIKVQPLTIRCEALGSRIERVELLLSRQHLPPDPLHGKGRLR